MTSTIATRLDETAEAVLSATKGAAPPRIGLVLGTGLGAFVERMRNVVSLPCSALPHMPVPRTLGNAGNICFGAIDDVAVVCLQGRAHLYEGHPAWQVVHGVRLMARLGVRAMLFTDFCASIEPGWSLETMMVVTDHLELSSSAASFGEVDEGKSLPPATSASSPYDALLSGELHEAARTETALASRIGKPVEIALEDGVYGSVLDPRRITPAQARMAHALGVSVLGAGLVPEAWAARELGVRAAAMAFVGYAATSTDAAAEEATTGRHFAPSCFDRIVRAWVLRAHRAEL